MFTKRRALLHSTHIYVVSPNSWVPLYNVLLYWGVYTVENVLYSICLHIYNTVALIKNNSTVLFYHPLLGSLLKQKSKISSSRKPCCKEDKPAGSVRNETILPAEKWIALYSSLWVSVSLSWGKTFCAMLKKETGDSQQNSPLSGSPTSVLCH